MCRPSHLLHSFDLAHNTCNLTDQLSDNIFICLYNIFNSSHSEFYLKDTKISNYSPDGRKKTETHGKEMQTEIFTLNQ